MSSNEILLADGDGDDYILKGKMDAENFANGTEDPVSVLLKEIENSADRVPLDELQRQIGKQSVFYSGVDRSFVPERNIPGIYLG